MENKSHAIAAGAFVVVVAALLVTLAVWLTRDSSERRVYEIASQQGVTGLLPQAAVRYKGVLVGRVPAIALDSTARGGVLVRLNVDSNVPVTASTFATLGFQGITGLSFIQPDDAGSSQEALQTSDATPARARGSQTPRSERIPDTEPAEVMRISSGCAPNACATVSRATSIAWRACCALT